MNRSQRRFLKLIEGVQNAYREAVYKALRAQIDYFADQYEPGMTPTYLPTKDLIQALRGIYEAAGVPNAQYTRSQIRRQVMKANDTPSERIRWMINEYYRRFLLDGAVRPITDTTRKQILRVLQQANEGGWGVKETVGALRDTDITKTRAELIVRTESMKAANAGAMIGAAELGFAVQKEWISAQDNRTRRIPRDKYDHLHMRGVRVGYTERFIVPSTQSIDAMLYPGDPEASAGNLCNCRCTTAFIPIRDGQGKPIPFATYNPVGSAGNIFLQLAAQAAQTIINAALINQLIESIQNEGE